MSFPEYKNFDKCAADIIKEDFDMHYSVKVKSTLPNDIGLTSTTDCCCGKTEFPTKLNFKWNGPKGFAIDKFEVAGCDKLTLETSLSGIAPGLQLKFKGANTTSAAVTAIYKHKFATLVNEIDVMGSHNLKTSIVGGSHGVQVGAAANVSLAGKAQVDDYSAAIGYTPNCGKFFVGLKANNKLADLNAAIKYQMKPNLALAALVDYTPSNGNNNFNVGMDYQICENATMKLKVNNKAVINASVKKQFPNKCTVVGAAGIDVKNINAYTLGVTATLG
eukprot:TRINITY_DN59681_c0_g1_i1.p1 TRINITY_DN59681_c0_g1~~TRINITY_DN59681_c0_g1_i1.p1  ORF type:complete len:276 (+),score=14.17 TRINITY_DN59681_c0_g1_i1:119-946(+)